jgi:hypothetical protein
LAGQTDALESSPNVFIHSYAVAAIELGQAVQAALANQKQTAKTLPSRQRWQVLQRP